MNKWVCVYVSHPDRNFEGKVLLVKKNKPLWQSGFLNLLGGSIEVDETPEEASKREVKEEAGITIEDVSVLGVIKGDWGSVYCAKGHARTSMIKPRKGETEEVKWWQWQEARDSGLLIPNLFCIIPMMQNNVRGWTIFADEPNWDSGKYKISVELPISKH